MMVRIRNLFRRNLPEKFMALTVATILWLVVMNDQNPTIDGTYTVPVTVLNAPQGYRMVKEYDDIQMNVRAPRSLFASYETSDFKAYVNLYGLEEGQHTLKVEPVAPQGFEIVEILPASVSVTLDPFVEKQFPAELIVTGTTAPGTTVAKVTQSSSMVTVVGPKSMVETVTRVIGYVGLSNNSADFSLQVPLTAINEDGREVAKTRPLPSVISVDVQLARGLSKRILPVLVDLADDLSPIYEVEKVVVEPSQIEVAGNEDAIGKLAGIRTEKVSLADAQGKTFSKNAKLMLPEGATVTNNTVTVEIDLKDKVPTASEIRGEDSPREAGAP